MLCLKDVFSATSRCVAAALAFSFVAGVAGVSGQTVPSPVNLSSSVGGGSNPVMALDPAGAIDVAWVGTGIFFARSTDGGVTFSTTTVLPLTSPPPGLQMGLDAAGDIALLWPTSPDDTHPAGSAFLTRSTDAGLTFSTPAQFDPPVGVTSTALQMAVEPGGGIDIAWLDQARANLSLSRSTDGGATFPSAAQVWAVSGDLADLHAVTGATGQIYVFWTHIASGTQCDVLFNRTLDGGATFSGVANVSNTNGACSASPVPAIDPNGGINVAWLVNNQSVWFSRSNDHGSTFTAPVNASGGVQSFLVSGQQIGTDPNGEIDVVWTTSLAENTVLLAHSDDQGATFSVPKIISLPPRPNNTGAGNAAIGEDSCGGIFVAWSDDSVGPMSGEFDAFLDLSTNDGVTFSNPLNLSNTANEAEVVAQIAVDAQGNSNVLWTTTNFPFNVFFTRVPESVPQTGTFETVVFPRVLTAAQGATDSFMVAAAAFREAHETVNFSCSDLPPFSTCTFNPPSVVTQSFISLTTMTLTVPATLAPGIYLFGVNGVSPSTTKTQTVELTVTAPGAMPAARAVTSSFGGHRWLGGPATSGCSSANEQLCSALHPGQRRWPRVRGCRGFFGLSEQAPRRELSARPDR